MDISRFLQAARQGCVDPHGVSRYWKDSPSPPPAPDYRGAAQETSAGNLEATRAATAANRINQYTPYGSQVYTETSPDQWRSDLSLDPRAQRTLDTQMGLSNQMGDITGRAMGAVGAQGPMDTSSVRDVANDAYRYETDRLDPQWQQKKGQFDQQMANQGIVAGGEAYDNAARVYGEQENDAYSQARKNAIGTMPQTYQLAQALYDQPLNRANALRTGAQVQNPTFQQAGMQQATPGANYLGAAGMQNQYDMGLYNSQIGSNNSMTSGLFQIGAAAATAY